MPTLETKIWMALKKGLVAAAGTTPVAWPGSSYAPGAAAFLSVAMVPAAPQRTFVAGRKPNERVGLLVTQLRSPIEGLVYEVAQEQAAAIAASFQSGRGLKFLNVCVSIPRDAEVGGGYREGSWWHTPINIPWRVTAQP